MFRGGKLGRTTSQPSDCAAAPGSGYGGPMSAPIEHWWPRLSQETRDLLIASNGDQVPASVVAQITRAGGSVSTDDRGSGHHTPEGTYLPDEVVDWIEAVANGETPPPS
jgi:hypothetical protein